MKMANAHREQSPARKSCLHQDMEAALQKGIIYVKTKKSIAWGC